MNALSDAERLLQDLGIASPDEIDLEAVAYDQGVTVKYRRLQGCEARIVGQGSRGIISVDERTNPQRMRFSIGHELGHWHRHRGRALICRQDDIGNPRHHVTHPERIADRYAADLLMPGFLFDPLANQWGHVGVEALQGLRDQFHTSVTATAIRLVERGPEPALLVCYGRDGRRWFTRSRGVPERWFPRQHLDPDTFAHDLLTTGGRTASRHLMDAEAWFDRDDAGDFELWEESIRINAGQILAFLVLKDDEMLEERGRY